MPENSKLLFAIMMLLLFVHPHLFGALPMKASPVVKNPFATTAEISDTNPSCAEPETPAIPAAKPAEAGEDYSSSALSTTTGKQGAFSKGFQWIKRIKNYLASLTHPLSNGKDNRDNGLAVAAFICGCLGVLTVGIMFLPVTFSGTAIDIAIASIIVLGSFAFWAGREVVRNDDPGLGWAIAAMVLGCITILPPFSWLVVHNFLHSGRLFN